MNETRKSRQGKKRILKTVLSVLMIAMVGVIAYMFKAYSDIGSTAESIYNEVSVVEMREESIEVETATQPISFVLLGVDTGTAEEKRTETGRSDTIIVCTVNPNTRTTTLLSIPRDNEVKLMISASQQMGKLKYFPIVFDLSSDEMFESVFLLADFRKSIK